MNNFLEVFKLDSNAILPTRTYKTDAGADLYALKDVFIPLGSTVLIETGIAIKIPVGQVGLIRERSSIGKKGLKATGGVIDALYSGDCSVLLMNLSNNDSPGEENKRGYLVKSGDRIAQIVLLPVNTPEIKEVNTLWSSDRGDKGFGSSGN